MKIRMPQNWHVKRLLGVKDHLPKNGMPPTAVEISDGPEKRILFFRILTKTEADERSRSIGNKQPGRGRPRIMVQHDCGQWISAGRFNQHERYCK